MNKVFPILSYNDISKDQIWKYFNGGPPIGFGNKDLGLTDQYCNHPFNTMTIDKNGDIFVCICQSWLPVSIANVFDLTSLNEVFIHPKTQIIQSSILDGSYRYCNENLCSVINQNSFDITVPTSAVTLLNFVIDESCNLTCPSCRNELKFVKEGTEKYKFKTSLIDKIIQLINSHHGNLKFTLSGDGDPFASLVYRYFLSNLDLRRQPNIELEICTNGLLLKDFWHLLNNLYNNIVRVKISLDAGSEYVYEHVRRGGNWNKILENLKFITDWKKQNLIDIVITTNFVVQNSNFKDMENYILLCLDLDIDEINFQKIDNWGTFKDFDLENIFDYNHENFQEFRNTLKNTVFQNKKINYTNMQTFYHEIT